MADVKWIKIVTDIFSNRKIKQIEAMPDADSILVIWLKLLCLSGNLNDGGLVTITKDIPYTDEMLATEFNRPIGTVRLALATFDRFGMIEIVDNVLCVSNWEKYQNVDGLEKVREQNKLRKRKQREKIKELTGSVTSHVTVTQCHATDKEIDKEIDKDILLRTSAQKERFESFWKAYPKKKSKGDAEKAWKSINPSEELVATMLEKLAQAKTCKDWQKDNGQFIPYPATWLRAKGWEDEYEQQSGFAYDDSYEEGTSF